MIDYTPMSERLRAFAKKTQSWESPSAWTIMCTDSKGRPWTLYARYRSNYFSCTVIQGYLAPTQEHTLCATYLPTLEEASLMEWEHAKDLMVTVVEFREGV